ARIGSLHALRWLFSSPLYLLLDDADRLSLPDRTQLSRDLSRLRTEDPTVGVLATYRDERTARLLRNSDITIRELSEQQIRSLIKERHGHASLFNLLIDNVAPIARHMRNPQLLSLLCELSVTDKDLAKANLKTILELYVAYRRRRVMGDRSAPAVGAWLG